MKIIEPSHKIEAIMPENAMEHLEKCTRTCYRSEGKIGEGSAAKLMTKVLIKGHGSVIEHASATVRFVCDRGVSHELVRHRLCAISQESTRYVAYCGGDEEGHELSFVKPCFWEDPKDSRLDDNYNLWLEAMDYAEQFYLTMLKIGAKPEEARSVLPNSLRTELVVTANFREWIHILKLRTGKRAHPQMRQLMIPLGHELADKFPIIFGAFGEMEK
jgi:thymidylate synthase (FAD)